MMSNHNMSQNKARSLLLQALDLLFQVEKLSCPLSREHLLAATIRTSLQSEQTACLHETCSEPGKVASETL